MPHLFSHPDSVQPLSASVMEHWQIQAYGLRSQCHGSDLRHRMLHLALRHSRYALLEGTVIYWKNSQPVYFYNILSGNPVYFHHRQAHGTARPKSGRYRVRSLFVCALRSLRSLSSSPAYKSHQSGCLGYWRSMPWSFLWSLSQNQPDPAGMSLSPAAR